MRTLVLCGLASLLWLQPPGAKAEILHFEYSQHAKLEQAMSTEGGRVPPVYTQDRAPRYVLTRYVIEGTSAEEWTEVIDVMNTNRKAEPKTLGAWYERFREQGEKTCPGEWTVIAETPDSLTFERKTPECAPHPAQHALYKVLYGKRDAFTVTCTRKGTMTSEDRAGWLAFLEKVYLSDKF
jgi:hypothetical protein